MKKYILLIICLISFKAYSQDFIGKSKDDILKYGKHIGGNIIFDGEENGFAHSLPYHAINFIASPTHKNGAIFLMSFSLRNDSCFKYTLAYSDKSLKQNFIDKFNKLPYKRQGSKLIWIDRQNNIQIELVNVRNNGTNSDAFSLIFQKIDKG